MGLFHRLIERIDDFLDRHQDQEPNAYNYTYFPPVAMVDEVPRGQVSGEWLFKVALLQLRIVLNLLAITKDDDLEPLHKELQDLEDADSGVLEKAQSLVAFTRNLAEIDHDATDSFCDSLRELLVDLTAPDSTLVTDALNLYLMVQNKLLEGTQDQHLASLQEYEDLFKYLKLPKIAATFQEDATFAKLRVAGPNPTTLTRINALPAHFPVSEALFQQVMGADDDLTSALTAGRVYLIDYAILAGAVQGAYPGPQKFLSAPMALFAVPRDGGDLRVVAIQCGQTPGADCPVIGRPTDAQDEDGAARWAMAKNHFSVADGNYHEAVAHLGRTHLVISPFSIATPNQLSKHPIGKLLMPHFTGTMSINNAAQATLIASEGIIDQILGGTIDTSRVLGAAGTLGVSQAFDQHFFPETLKARGVDDPAKLPYYPYRDAGLMVWDAIHTWVSAYVSACYEDEDGPAGDEALQKWHAEVVNHYGGRVQGFKPPTTRTYLAECLTMVIFTASAAHAAVNFPQAPIMSYPPAMPMAAYSEPPRADQTYTNADYLRSLPPLFQSAVQINTLVLLGSIYYTRLGDYGDDYFQTPEILAALGRFQARLREIDTEVATRFPDYPYLMPSQIPQSINI